jgi:hypothetical protein
MARKREFLDNKHDVYLANIETWRRNEIRFKAGAEVFGQLPRFAYEVKKGGKESAHYLARQLTATYLNFGYDFAEMIAGFLMQKGPTPENGLDFGELGKIRPATERQGDPERAEMFFDNVDGVGNQGSIWPNFWTHSHIETYPFGHILQFVEAPSAPPETQAGEIVARPFLKNFKASQVFDWYVEDGEFQYLIVRVKTRRPRVERGRMTGSKATDGYYLLVAEGFDGLGEDDEADFSEGGWYLFDANKELLRDRSGEPEEGRWEDALDGSIPAWYYYYMRDKGTDTVPAISRPGVTELLNCAVSYMAVSSAADTDFLEAAASILYIIGADKKVAETVAEQHAQGNKIVGVPRPRSRQDADVALHDGSTGAVTADVAETRLKRKLAEAHDLMLREATSTPDSSGESKRAGHAERKAPKLALHASELETAMTNAIDATQRRWGITRPTGRATMTRDFDLSPLAEKIDEYFTIRNKGQAKSKTADVEAFMALVVDKLGISDKGKLSAIRAEAEAAIDTAAQLAARAGSLESSFA